MIRICCSRTSGMKELIVSCFSSGPVILTECAAVFPSLSLCPPFSISISFPFLSFHFFLPFPPCSTLFLLLHPFSYTSLSLSLCTYGCGAEEQIKRERERMTCPSFWMAFAAFLFCRELWLESMTRTTALSPLPWTRRLSIFKVRSPFSSSSGAFVLSFSSLIFCSLAPPAVMLLTQCL